MTAWPTVIFEDLYSEPSRNGINRPRSVRGSGYKMINMGELFAYGRIKDPPMERVPMNEREKSTYGVKRGDLLFARQSLVREGAGKCSIVLEVPETTCFEGHLIRVRLDLSKVDPLFYYYYFASHVGHSNVQSLVMQVAAAGIRGSELAKLQVPYPPLPTQRKIADILSAYDDLIENNTRRIQILEEMAQTIYREWFVHFRFPGHEDVEMVETELGLVPKGWEICWYTDKIDVMSGGTPRTSIEDYWNGQIPWCTPRDMGTGWFVLTTERCITELGLSKCTSKLYPADTVFITARGTVGRCVLAGVPMAMSQTSYALSGRNVIPQEFVFLMTLELVDVLRKGATGAVFDTIIVDTFRRLPVCVPPIQLLGHFGEAVAPMFSTLKNLLLKNSNLRQTRDMLLPKLVSGEYEISDARTQL